jgi:hypothetical protein
LLGHYCRVRRTRCADPSATVPAYYCIAAFFFENRL